MGGGLYVIRLSDTHYYGGRSRDIRRRWKHHKTLLDTGKHHNKFMQSVYNQHHRFEPELLMPIDGHEDQVVFEQYWIDANIGRVGCVNMHRDARGASPEALSLAQVGLPRKGHTPESRAKIGAKSKGRRLSPESIAKMANALRGRKRGPHSQETKAKIGAGRLGKKQPPHVGEAVARSNRLRRNKNLYTDGQQPLFEVCDRR